MQLQAEFFIENFRTMMSTNIHNGEIVDKLSQHFVSYRIPKVITSDRGSAFISQEFCEFLKLMKLYILKLQRNRRNLTDR